MNEPTLFPLPEVDAPCSMETFLATHPRERAILVRLFGDRYREAS